MEHARWLRIALRLNAIFSLVTGTAAIASAETVARLLDVPPAVPLFGVGLCLYAVFLLALSLRRRVASIGVVTASGMDVAWVVGSLVFLAVHEVPSPTLVLGTSAFVLAFAMLQLEGLRRAVFSNGRGRFELARDVNAPAEDAWSVVSDVGGYAEFASTLHRSEVVSGSGLGMVRRCEDADGICWTETCARWEPGRGYAFEVDTTAPGYPLPLRTMRGDFEVDALGDRRSRVRIRFAFSARGGALTELLLASVFAARGDHLVGDVLRRWAERIERAGASASAPSKPHAHDEPDSHTNLKPEKQTRISGT